MMTLVVISHYYNSLSSWNCPCLSVCQSLSNSHRRLSSSINRIKQTNVMLLRLSGSQ